jgi:hypothetical protein
MDIDLPERASNNLQVMMLIETSWMRNRELELTATVLGSGRNLFVMDISAMLYATLDERIVKVARCEGCSTIHSLLYDPLLAVLCFDLKTRPK